MGRVVKFNMWRGLQSRSNLIWLNPDVWQRCCILIFKNMRIRIFHYNPQTIWLKWEITRIDHTPWTYTDKSSWYLLHTLFKLLEVRLAEQTILDETLMRLFSTREEELMTQEIIKPDIESIHLWNNASESKTNSIFLVWHRLKMCALQQF